MMPRAAGRADLPGPGSAATGFASPRRRADHLPLRFIALALLLAAVLLGGMLAGPPPPASATALAVSAIAIQSSAGSDTQYHAGEDIVIRVTFGTETITAHTGATITIDVGGENRTATAADVASGGANAYVDFTYTVADADRDTDGVTVAAGALGGSYTHTDVHPGITFTQTVSASASHRVNVNVTNYDTDGDGLIEINSLAQLNAIRWDLDGNGQPAASISSYAAAFPARSESHGCPDTAADADTDPGPCLGYELRNSLDFDTNGDGAVNASDAYPSWTPIGNNTTRYTANFNGNGHTISNLTINITSGQLTGAFRSAGLFGHIVGDLVIENVGLTDVNITVNFGNGTALVYAGALVGYFEGALRTSYATGTIAATAGTGYIVTNVGGLVGYVGTTAVSANRIDATWAAVNVSATSSATGANNAGDEDAVGGLVGRLISDANTSSAVTASYARGTATATRANSSRGGLVGISSGAGATATAGYWDTVTSSLTSSAGGTGQTTTALQTPTGYTGIYAAWNTDVDGDGNADDPWDFGTGSQYPVLKYASHDFAAQGRPFDYDADNDGLIDITTLAQLDAIRHDLNGDGDPAGAAGAAAFREAFPHRERSVAGRMGCQLTDHDSNTATPDQATCTGYELLNNLDFDTNGDGAVNASDDYPNWTPIAGDENNPYIATFRGNGHSINNLRSIHYGGTYIGLFGVLGTRGNGVPQRGRIDTLAVTNANVLGWQGVGILVGMNSGHILGSYVTGSITGTSDDIGGLAGATHHPYHQDRARIIASYSTATVTGPGRSGGLVGLHSNGPIIASYAAGKVTSTSNSGGLTGSGIGSAFWVGTYANSYWDQGVTTQSNSYNSSQSGVTTGNVGTSVSSTTGATTTGDLKSPTDYTGIYATWDDHDLDGDGSPDDAWDFGTDSEYPALAYGGHNLAAQGRTVVDYDDDNDGLIDITTLAQLDAVRYDLNGDGDPSDTAYNGAFLNRDRNAAGRMGCPDGACTGYELLNSLDFDSNGDGAVTDADAYPNWTPIGGPDSANAYTGTFRGNGHSIANLAISSGDLAAVGLFGVVSGSNAVVESLGLTGAAITPSYAGAAASYDVGALAGYVGDGGTVRGNYATGAITAMASGSDAVAAVGGLVGRAGPGAGIAASYAGVAVAANSTATAGGNDAAGGLVGKLDGAAGNLATVTATYATGTAAASRENAAVGGLVGAAENATVSASYWDTRTSGIADDADDNPPEGKISSQLKRPTRYSGIYATWDDQDLDGDGQADDPWDFGTDQGYPLLKWGGHDIYKQGRPRAAAAEPEEYVAPPIVYNLNIRFSVKRLALDEGESGSYRVRMTQAPAGHPARVTIRSNNSDVVVSPTELVFSAADYDEWQTVAVNVLRDPNDTDESAYLTHRGPRLSYGGLIVTVNDVWPGTTTETVNGHTITVRNTASAPLGVTVTAPATLDLDTEVTVSGAPSDTPQSASGYGLGEAAEARMAASIRVNGAPADGLNICLPLPAALVTEAGERALTLLRYAGDDGGWSAVAGAERRSDAVCADGVTEYGVFAAAYVAPDALGTPADLAAAPGAAAGSVVLTWTPAAYAARHFVFGIKQSDAAAGDTSNLAAWTFAERPNVHTVAGLESGAAYYFTVTAGRASADGGNEWSPWAPWVVAAPN